MKQNWNPDKDRLYRHYQRQASEKLHLVGVSLRTVQRGGVGDEDVLEKKGADRNDAAEGMQPPPKKLMAAAGTDRRNAAPAGAGGRTSSGSQAGSLGFAKKGAKPCIM